MVEWWLAKAENDLLAAQAILNALLPSYETAGFHAQQAAEKGLKAFLTRHQIDFSKTHDLGELLRLADPAAPGIAARLADAEKLNRYAVDTRYPTSAPPVGGEEATRDLAIAANVMETVRELLKAYLDAGRPGR